MAKINLKNSEVEETKVEETKVEETKVEETQEKQELSGDSKKIYDFLKSKGSEGATANNIAVHLGWLTKDSSKEEKKEQEYKVRRLVRSVVDKQGGSREVRNGRNKVYQITK